MASRDFDGAPSTRDGALQLRTATSHVRGTTPALISLNSGSPKLVLQSEAGEWRLRPGDYRGKAFGFADVTVADDSVTLTAHALEAGDGPFRLTSDGVDLPLNLLVDTNYFVGVVDANTVQLALTLADALAGVFVAIADQGTGNFVLGGPADGAGSGLGWANAAVPAASVTDYGSTLLGSGATVELSAPRRLTAVAFNAADVLTHWFEGDTP